MDSVTLKSYQYLWGFKDEGKDDHEEKKYDF